MNHERLNLVRPLFWYSGQYLDPQHLQQTDIFHQQQIAGLLEHLVPWFWGVDVLEVNEELLHKNCLSLSRLGIRFPDGSRGLVTPRREDGTAVIESRDFSTAWTRRNEPFIVYVGLYALAQDRNVAGILSPENIERPAKGRFFAAESDELLSDRYGLPQQAMTDDKAPARTLYYSLRLFWASELAEASTDHHVFPLLRLHEVEAVIKIDESFCPPLLHIKVWKRLYEDLRVMRNRLSFVTARLQSTIPASLFEGNVTPAFSLLQAIEETIASFDMAMHAPAPLPWDIFTLLRCGLAKMLSCLPRTEGKQRFSPAELPLYTHEDIVACFAVLLEQYERIAQEILPSIAASCRFSAAGEFFDAYLADACLLPGRVPVLVVQSNEEMAELLAQGRFILAATDSLGEIVRYALPGVSLHVLDAPPAGLPRHKGVYYLRIDIESQGWQDIIASRRLSVAFFPDTPCSPDVLETRLKMLFLGK